MLDAAAQESIKRGLAAIAGHRSTTRNTNWTQFHALNSLLLVCIVHFTFVVAIICAF